MSTRLPLSELLDELRHEGLPIGVDDHVRLQRLLACEAGWTVPRLKTALRVLVAKDPEQIAIFDAVFDRFFQAPLAPPERLAPVPQEKLPGQRFDWQRMGLLIGGLAVAAVAVVRVWAHVFPAPPVPIARTAGPAISAPVAVVLDAGIEDVPERSADAGSKPRGSDGAQHPLVEPSTLLPPLLKSCQPAPSAPAYTGPLEIEPLPSARTARVAAVCAGTAFLLLLAAWLLQRRRRALRRRFWPGPSAYRRALDPVRSSRNATIEASAADLVSAARADPSRTLDVPSTVRATSKAGGYPRLVFARSVASPRYAIVLDVAPSAQPWLKIYRDMAADLRRAGVDVSEYTFEQSPSLCHPVTGSGPSIPLSTLADRVDAAIFVGDGDAATGRLDAAPARWLAELERIPRRLWLNPLPPARWSAGAHAITQRTPMAHGTSAGFAALLPGWVPERRIDDDRILPPVVLLAPGSAVAIAALRRHLDEAAFAWLCACAVAGEPDANLALWLQVRAGLAIREADRLRLLALPWFAGSRWPPGLRERLAAVLRAEQPDLATRVHRALLDLLDRSQPAVGTLAHLRWRLDRAVHAVRTGERLDPQAATELVESPIHAAAEPALGALGLRSRGGVAAGGALALGALFVLAGAGTAGAAGYRWLSTTVQFCASWSLQRGQPVCVAPLTDAVRARRTESYRFEYRRGRLSRMQRVNGEGALKPLEGGMIDADYYGKGVAQWVPSFAGDGTLRWLDRLDRNGTLVFRLDYVRRSEREWLVWFRDRSLQLHGVSNSAVVGDRWTLDDRGVVTRAEHVDEQERPSPLPGGDYAIDLAYDGHGRPVTLSYLSSSLVPQARKHSAASERVELNERGEDVARRVFDECGSPALDESLIHASRATRDASGNVVEVAYFDTEDKPTLNKDGVAHFTASYDEHGNRVGEAYFDTTGKPAPNKDGGARLTLKYDERGNVMEGAYFNTEDKPAPDKDGYARFTAKYDERGNVVEAALFDVEGNSTLNKDGYARLTRKYDEHGDMVEEAHFDAAGKPMPHKDGYARFTQRYDERGDVAETAFFDVEGKPTPNKDGYARLTRKYDEHGDMVEEAHFDAAGKPTPNKDGYARRAMKYDERGNLAEEAYFDTAGKPTSNKDGYARRAMKYDERGNLAEEAYFDTAGKPTSNKDGYARRAMKYDERGNSVEEAYFDAEGQPTPNKDGNARLTVKYDERDNLVGFTRLDGEGRSIAGFTQKLDERGNSVEVVFLDAAGKPTLNKDGVARRTREHDERGNVVAEAYFDADGKPMLSKDGYASGTLRRDEHGNLVEEAYFDAAGKPTPNKSGYARRTLKYDERGNLVEEAYFDAEGKPTPAKYGYVRWTVTHNEGGDEGWHTLKRGFDAHGREVVTAYYDTGGAPVVTTMGYAAVGQRWDDRGNLVEKAFYGLAGGLALSRADGYARAVFAYDARDHLIRTTKYDASGHADPPASPSKPSGGYFRRSVKK